MNREKIDTDMQISQYLACKPRNPGLEITHPVAYAAAYMLCQENWPATFTKTSYSSAIMTELGDRVKGLLLEAVANPVSIGSFPLSQIRLGTGRTQASDAGGLVLQTLERIDEKSAHIYRSIKNGGRTVKMDVFIEMHQMKYKDYEFVIKDLQRKFMSYCAVKYQGFYYWSKRSFLSWLAREDEVDLFDFLRETSEISIRGIQFQNYQGEITLKDFNDVGQIDLDPYVDEAGHVTPPKPKTVLVYREK